MKMLCFDDIFRNKAAIESNHNVFFGEEKRGDNTTELIFSRK